MPCTTEAVQLFNATYGERSKRTVFAGDPGGTIAQNDHAAYRSQRNDIKYVKSLLGDLINNILGRNIACYMLDGV